MKQIPIANNSSVAEQRRMFGAKAVIVKDKETPSQFRARVEHWAETEIGHTRYALCSVLTCVNYEEWEPGLSPVEIRQHLSKQGWRWSRKAPSAKCPEHSGGNARGA